MAEAIARDLEKRHGTGVEFSSAGTRAIVGSGATPEAEAAIAELGLVLRWHKARQLSPDVASEANLLVALNDEHLGYVERHFPEAAVELLGRIPDPYGLDGATYRAVRDQIATAVAERSGAWFSAG